MPTLTAEAGEQGRELQFSERTDYDPSVAHPPAARYIVEFMLNTRLLGHMNHVGVAPKGTGESEESLTPAALRGLNGSDQCRDVVAMYIAEFAVRVQASPGTGRNDSDGLRSSLAWWQLLCAHQRDLDVHLHHGWLAGGSVPAEQRDEYIGPNAHSVALFLVHLSSGLIQSLHDFKVGWPLWAIESDILAHERGQHPRLRWWHVKLEKDRYIDR
ncbi:hypothetical protein BO86DRAFT_396609 [Aspergillus japonicus CBS 114.51]|uniref:Uncharacterized protein n=1 Tax=Aspergillus japonicus CBS 114.51 TaxID=1448312 RepID=A0A8T8X9X8_ASPJA|nr:hypothetical protein BO86DRAFT_396609 [Aspergillus japonicus CBS 114.51]RAH84976.1 hypothetical protein BO86DRAFT_396609 [Aspergillus japonicus CBS 114.51]